MCNNITKLIDLMQEIEEDLKLALLRSKEFQPLCSIPHVPMLVHLDHNKQSAV